ncbi:membrane-associated guanylate kinase, WW and PDZ domain-containing protein 1-like isoform X2 [Poecilia formosa]|uniref:membrane-associated guanylate kinase, WW and PDZ domain-containing protein 1-like isoform X2 n=1 Tax=Poecilia formosa TaxID=48698 RepID=UPI0007BA28CC|nr:PREDICTED: membrane-associated guanylate kinase, WW and PDZ domain-containing protein 1-like isoform X2 [Poecilia formosa]
MSHRFVTVRRGSPAARSGQIRPGDRLEAVEGRPVAALQHRDLAQILRRAGNTLRLGVARKSSSDGADFDTDRRLVKGPRGRSKDETRFYSVDLERGPTGFGFSLRGGSEYNMGLYVLGLMDGGPAQRSSKIQVSDQLVEINGGSTAGMTHSQAVEQIRRGGNRIHLVLKKGNGYVPDYVELSSLSLCMTNSRQGEPCFYVIGRTENSRP